MIVHPCPGARISQYFGENPGKFGYGPEGHQGVDFSVPVGTSLPAPMGGRIIIGEAPNSYGLYVIIEYENVRVLLAHLSSVALDSGAWVKPGAQIVGSGNSGNSTGPHVHVGFSIDGVWVDPLPYLEETMVSKIAVHYQTKPEYKDDPRDTVHIVAHSKMKWVKVINAEEMAPDTFPNQRVMARLWIEWDGDWGDSLEAKYYRRGAAGARDYFERLRPRYDRLKAMGILDVEGPNEPQATCQRKDDPAQYDADWGVIAEFYYEWARLCIEYGMRPWVFSNSTGTPELEILHVMANTLKLASDAGGGWAVHEYWAPSSFDAVGYHPLRIVRMLDHLATLGIPRGTLNVGITEAGMDGGIIPWNDPPWAGKRRRIGWKEWNSWGYTGATCMGLPDPQGGMTEELYWRHLDSMDDEYCKIPEVKFDAIYGGNPNKEWSGFVLEWALVQRMATKSEGNEAPEPDDAGIIARAHEIVLPLNPDAGLAKAGIARGLTPASDEDYELGFPIQVFRTAEDYARLHIGVWQNGQVRWIEDAN